MKEHYVSYDCAVKLKELGFDWECDHFYYSMTKKFCDWSTYSADNYNTRKEKFSAPRLDQAQAWLRDCKDMDVLVFNCACGYGWEISKAVKDITRGTRLKRYDYEGEHEDSGMWLSYESALSAGIYAALGILTNKQTDK